MNPALKQIFDTVRDGVVLVNPEGQVRFANQAAGKLLGAQPLKELPAAQVRYLNLPSTLDFDFPESARAPATGGKS